MSSVGYDPQDDQRYRPKGRESKGPCEWCHEPAWVTVVIHPGKKGKFYKAPVTRLACPHHAASFARQEAEIRS